MERYFGLTELASKHALSTTAFSALPDAPVLPYVEPRRRLATALARLRSPARRPAIALRGTRFSAAPPAEC